MNYDKYIMLEQSYFANLISGLIGCRFSRGLSYSD
jgi:hypothetical protein